MFSDARYNSEPPGAEVVLVVEDDADLRVALVELLRDDGYLVRSAGNGREAVAALCERPLPLLVVLDLKMPEMDGVEFLQVKASYRRWAPVPVVVVSAYAAQLPPDAHNVVEAMPKPIDMEALRTHVARYARPTA